MQQGNLRSPESTLLCSCKVQPVGNWLDALHTTIVTRQALDMSSCAGFQVGLYQLAKVAIIPCVATLEAILFGKRYTWSVMGAMTMVMAGLAVRGKSHGINPTWDKHL